MINLYGRQVLQMKKVSFPQMTMGAFPEEKNIWQDLAQLQPKTYGGCFMLFHMDLRIAWVLLQV